MSTAVRAGYKLTEVGVIPEDWEVKKITDVCDFIVPGRNKPQFSIDTIPWVTTTDLEDGGDVFESRLGLSVSRGEANRVGSRVVPAGSIVMSCVGELGITAYARRDIVINQQLHAFIPSKLIDGRFLLHAVRTRTSYLEGIATKTTLPYLNKDNCNSILLPFPVLHEQRAIAIALSDVDALLAKLDALIAKKRDLKVATMQQLLTGQTRLPGFSGEWEVKRLGDAAEIVMGQSPSSASYNTKGLGLPLIQGNADVLDRKTIQRIFTTDITKRGKCGDILLSVRAPVGEISRAGFDVCLGRGVCAVRYKSEFLYHYLIGIEPTWARLSKGSTFDSVNSTDVRALEVHLPSDDAEQGAISNILSDIDTELTALEARRDKTRALKQGMMQELLTGRIRLVASGD